MFIINPYIFSAAGYVIKNALTLDGAADYLERTLDAADSARIGSLDFWIKRHSLGQHNILSQKSSGAGNAMICQFQSDDQFEIVLEATGGAEIVKRVSTTKLRDLNTWIHINVQWDSNQTDATSMTIRINGVTETASSTVNPSSAQDINFPTSSTTARLGRWYASSPTRYMHATIANFCFHDGVNVINGETDDDTGIWVPTDPTKNTFGNGGFFLGFTSSSVGADLSGNSQTFTISSIGTDNLKADSPTNDATGETVLYPALNPLTKNSSVNLTNANLTHTGTDGDIDTNTKVNQPLPSTGKFYFELVAGGSSGLYLGVVVGSCANNESGNGANKGFLYNQANGKLYANPITASSGDAYGATWTTNDVIGVAIDMTNGGDMWFSKNDTWQNSATASEIAAGTTTNAAVTNMPTNTTNSRTYDGSGLFVSIGDSSASGTGTLRFASSSWTGTAPTGFGELTTTVTGVGNYATINAEAVNIAGNDDVTLSDGNLKAVYVADHAAEFSIARLTSGKWYWELTNQTSAAGSTGVLAGSYYGSYDRSANMNSTGIYYYNPFNGQKMKDGSGTSYGNAVGANDCLQVALDLDNDKIWWGVNNTWQNSGDPAAGSNEAYSDLTDTDYTPVVGYGAAYTSILNTGQTGLKYSPPTGFATLNTSNMTALGFDPEAHFKAAIYEGTGSELEISSLAFQPGITIIKNRDATDNWLVFDSVRGATKYWYANHSSGSPVEATDAQSLKSFDSDGFTLGTDDEVNTSSESFVSYNWKLPASATVSGGMTKTSDSSTTDTVRSVNTDAGVCCLTYTGTGAISTITHGLPSIPRWIFIKCLGSNTTVSAIMHHQNFSNFNRGYQYLGFNQYEAAFSDDRIWGATPATSTVIGVGTHDFINKSSSTYVAYAFSEIEGFSRFGLYTGNGNADGPFVYTGFKPAFLWIKRRGDGNVNGSPYVWDNGRMTANPAGGVGTVYPMGFDQNAAESSSGSGGVVDFLGNGFKIRSTWNDVNTSGAPVLYAAFAESPFSGNNRGK